MKRFIQNSKKNKKKTETTKLIHEPNYKYYMQRLSKVYSV